MNIVYVPQHLYPVLKQSGLHGADYRNIERLLDTLSPDDVAFYLFCNTEGHCPIPQEAQDTLPNLLFGPNAVMPFTSTGRSQETLTRYNSFVQNGCDADYCSERGVLSSDCMEEDLIIVTHTASADASLGNAVCERVFFDRLIQQLLSFKPLESVMGSPLMLGWLKSVSCGA